MHNCFFVDIICSTMWGELPKENANNYNDSNHIILKTFSSLLFENCFIMSSTNKMILYIYDSLLVVHVEFSFFVKWKVVFRISLGLRFLLLLLLFIIIFILTSFYYDFQKSLNTMPYR